MMTTVTVDDYSVLIKAAPNREYKSHYVHVRGYHDVTEKRTASSRCIHSHLVVEDFGFTGRSMNDEMVFEHGEHIFAGALQLLFDLSRETMTLTRAVHTIYSC